MTDKRKIIQLNETTEVNHETGEITKTTTENVVRLPKEPAYVKLYLDDISKLFDVPQGPRDLLHVLARKVDFDGFISLTPAGRQRICERCGIKEQTFRNYLTTLCKKDILKNIGRGEYELNPFLFGKGEWKHILRRRNEYKMKINITYDRNGKRTVESEAERIIQTDLEDFL